MESNDYCSYSLSLALKKCGFDWECGHYYLPPNENCPKPFFNGAASPFKNSPTAYAIAAPTLAVAQKWLREQLGLHVGVFPSTDSSDDADGRKCDEWQFWCFDIMQISSARFIMDGEGEYSTYEEALSEGIDAALHLLDNKKE